MTEKNDAAATREVAEKAAKRFLDVAAEKEELPASVAERWKSVGFQDDVAISKGALLGLFATLSETQGQVVEACNVALLLSQGDRLGAIAAFEKLALAALELQKQLEAIKNAIIAHTVTVRADD